MPISQIQKAASDLLGTLITTSGAAATLSGLDLTDYRFLVFVINGVSTSTVATVNQNGVPISQSTGTGGGNARSGYVMVDLKTSLGFATNIVVDTYNTGLNVNSTSITFNASAGTFDLGSIDVYGER